MEIAIGIAAGLIGIFLISCAIFFYFLPSYIAGVRRHKNFKPILLINILTGLTGIGWVVALIWAFIDERTVGQSL